MPTHLGVHFFLNGDELINDILVLGGGDAKFVRKELAKVINPRQDVEPCSPQLSGCVLLWRLRVYDECVSVCDERGAEARYMGWVGYGDQESQPQKRARQDSRAGWAGGRSRLATANEDEDDGSTLKGWAVGDLHTSGDRGFTEDQCGSGGGGGWKILSGLGREFKNCNESSTRTLTQHPDATTMAMLDMEFRYWQ